MPYISPNRLQKLHNRQKMLAQELLMHQRVMEGLRKNYKFNRLLKLIIDSVRQGMGLKRAGLFLVEPDRKSMRLALGINRYGRYERHQKKRPSYLIKGNDWFTRLVYRRKKYFLTNNYPKRGVRKAGSWEKKVVVLNSASVPIQLGQGRVIGILAVDNLGVNRPITQSDVHTLLNYATQVGLALQSVKAHERILGLAVTDTLTGLRNRRFFDEALDQEIKRCQRYGRACSLIMADLDHFKRINDQYGHAAGDEALKRVGSLLRDSVRTVDTVARIGGEEFAVLLPETPPNNISVVTKRLLRQIRELRIPLGTVGEPEPKLTISLGVASFRRGKVTPHQFLKLADKSLYRAKRGGRNRVGPQQLIAD
jgi:diguanylate cyclase (GGDEF)-like protein